MSEQRSNILAENSNPCLMQDSIVNTSISKSSHLTGEAGLYEEKRILHIKLLRGRYKNKLTPSEDFARKKTDEILLEG